MLSFELLAVFRVRYHNSGMNIKITNRSFLALILIAASLFYAPPAVAILGGSDATGNSVVVGLLRSPTATSAGCSGGLIASRIVFTAAHCLTGSADSVWVAQPGSDLRDITTKRIQGEKFYIPAGFNPSVFPMQNDFGIIVLKESFANFENIKVATSEEIAKWVAEESNVLHVGYGCTAKVTRPPCGVTSPTPNKIETTYESRIADQFKSLIVGTFTSTRISIEKTICGGDSGSPLLKDIAGKWIYLGAQSSSNGAGCTPECGVICVATQGLPAANKELVTSAYAYIGVTSPEIKTQLPVGKTSLKSITCIKGKLVKKVSALKPVCPIGYKKK
jgi:secreted trypsin-like serine protease